MCMEKILPWYSPVDEGRFSTLPIPYPDDVSANIFMYILLTGYYFE